MKEILNDIILFDSSIDIIVVLVRILLAVLFGGIIGYERGKHGRHAGLRTHILVCLGAAMTSMAGVFSHEILGYTGDPLRIAAQVMSGIGFLGAGMIIVKDGNNVTGLTTAAGMWTTAAMGIAIGMGFYSGAGVLLFACIFTSTLLAYAEKKRKSHTVFYIEINELSSAGEITDKIRTMDEHCLIEIVSPKSCQSGNLGILITSSNTEHRCEFRCALEQIDGVAFSVIA